MAIINFSWSYLPITPMIIKNVSKHLFLQALNQSQIALQPN